MFAELALQRMLSVGGWNAVWVENWTGRVYYIRNQPGSWKLADFADDPETVPRHVRHRIEMLANLSRQKPTKSGNASKGSVPDIVTWNIEGDIRFFEAKRRGKDRPNENQKRFLSVLMDRGELDTFAFIEWEGI